MTAITQHISINQETMKIVRIILDNPSAIGVLVSKLNNGTTVAVLVQSFIG